MNYRLRRSHISDTEILGQVHARSWHETYAKLMPSDILAKAGSVDRRTAIRQDMFARSTPDWGHFLVESTQGQIVGFGDCGPAHEVKAFAPAEIYTLYLLKSVQGLGLGRQLVDRMLEHMAGRGFETAALSVLATNESALHFYRRLGGKEVNRSQTDFVGTVLPSAIYLWTNLKKPI